MDITDGYPKYLCCKVRLILVDEYHQLAIGAISVTKICALSKAAPIALVVTAITVMNGLFWRASLQKIKMKNTQSIG